MNLLKSIQALHGQPHARGFEDTLVEELRLHEYAWSLRTFCHHGGVPRNLEITVCKWSEDEDVVKVTALIAYTETQECPEDGYPDERRWIACALRIDRESGDAEVVSKAEAWPASDDRAMSQTNESDDYTYVAGTALEGGKTFDVLCNCGGLAPITGPQSADFVVCPDCGERIKLRVVEGDSRHVIGRRDGGRVLIPVQGAKPESQLTPEERKERLANYKRQLKDLGSRGFPRTRSPDTVSRTEKPMNWQKAVAALQTEEYEDDLIEDEVRDHADELLLERACRFGGVPVALVYRCKVLERTVEEVRVLVRVEFDEELPQPDDRHREVERLVIIDVRTAEARVEEL